MGKGAGKKDREKLAKLAKAKRQAAAVAKKSNAGETREKGATEEELMTDAEREAAVALGKMTVHKEVTLDDITHRTCTGELNMAEGAKDIKVISFSLSFHGENLIEDTTLELTYGRRYGLIGRNGSGKTTFLQAIASNDLELPDHIDKYLLKGEVEPSDKNAMECVIGFAQAEVDRLNQLEDKLMEDQGPGCPYLQDIYDRLDTLDPSTFEQRAGDILWGLGFNKKMMPKATSDMSGGWRMRVALAQALFIKPTLLVLDEPTNHLDLETCVWLENYLATYPHILLLISHSQDFLDGVCTNIMHLTPNRKLEVYKGNYTQYCTTKQEQEVQQEKEYTKEQSEIKEMKRFIASCGTFANAVKQANSRQKRLDKLYERGLIPPVAREHNVTIRFPACERLPPPVLCFEEAGFAYDGNKDDLLLDGLEFGVDMDSRIVLVGPNGAGKSTLLKMMVGELTPTVGDVKRHGHLKMARYNQHSEEVLDEKMTPLDWMAQEFPTPRVDPSEWRKQLGRAGISGKCQVRKIETMSDGQKTRLVFAWLIRQNPHMLLFDEPTNHLDMECIDALAEGINGFPGGMVLVSHDFRLLQQTAKSIWVVDEGKVTPWQGDIASYKKHLEDNFSRYEA